MSGAFLVARAVGPYDARGLPAEGAPEASDETHAALVRAGLPALADELKGLRHADVVRRPFVWRALESATDVDAVRLRPLRGEEARVPRPERAPGEPLRLDYAIEVDVSVDDALATDAIALPRAALATLLVPIVAGMLVDEGRARDLGEAEPLVTSPSAAQFVDPRLDAALEERPLLVTCGARFVAARAERGEPRVGRGIAQALGTREGARVVVHLPLGAAAIEEVLTLLGAAAPQP